MFHCYISFSYHSFSQVSFSSSDLPRNGLLMVECRLGRLLSNSRPVVITDDLAFAAELSQLLPEMLAELRFSQGSGWCCKSGESCVRGRYRFVYLCRIMVQHMVAPATLSTHAAPGMCVR